MVHWLRVPWKVEFLLPGAGGSPCQHPCLFLGATGGAWQPAQVSSITKSPHPSRGAGSWPGALSGTGRGICRAWGKMEPQDPSFKTVKNFSVGGTGREALQDPPRSWKPSEDSSMQDSVLCTILWPSLTPASAHGRPQQRPGLGPRLPCSWPGSQGRQLVSLASPSPAVGAARGHVPRPAGGRQLRGPLLVGKEGTHHTLSRGQQGQAQPHPAVRGDLWVPTLLQSPGPHCLPPHPRDR